MNSKSKISIILTSLICLTPFIISALFYNKLPDKVATHFDINGIPNGYSSKIVAAFGIPAFLFIINLITNFVMEKNPDYINVGKVITIIGKWTIPFISVFMQIFIIAYACGFKFNINYYVLIFLGLLIMTIGIYLPKCQQNRIVGIKTPWALKDKENWKKTHRISGHLWIISGLILCINSFINIGFINIVVITVMVVVPIIYSYVIYKNKEKLKNI